MHIERPARTEGRRLVSHVPANLEQGDGKTMRDSGNPAPEPFSKAASDRLVRLAYRFVWNRDDAEDVVQASLAAAHEQRETLREPQRWWSWLRQIVIHRCHTHSRKKGVRQEHWLRIAVGPQQTEAAASDGPATVDLKELVRRTLPDLPERQKEVIVLRHLEGMSYEQIGELLQIAPATARVHAKAGLETLRAKLMKPDVHASAPR
jgi:RNA polymerase sigma-70 factor (ECF subfamily)